MVKHMYVLWKAADEDIADFRQSLLDERVPELLALEPQALTVNVADVEKSLGQAKKLGGKQLMPPTKLPDGMTIAVFSDPEGHPVGLMAKSG